MEELGTVMGLLGQVCTETELGETIRHVDGDGNGTIEFEEFVKVMMQATSSMPNIWEEFEEEVKKAFSAFDKDQNGFISSEELSLVMNSLGDMPSEEDIWDMIRQADTDGDGSINYSEFRKIMMKDMSL